jgi:hypothetical protein
MIGLLYIILSFGLGWAICVNAFPRLSEITRTDCMRRKISVSSYIILLPAWYVTGTLALTWITYLLAYLNRGSSEPLLYANMIYMPLALMFTVYTFLRRRRLAIKDTLPSLCKDGRTLTLELILVIAIVVLANVLMWVTFFVDGDQLYVGVSVFSDFSPHIGMIRSFSYGNNFPTTYPHYAGEDIKYHFMFQFLAGNLEYLGLRIDYAFNLPSILSFISAFLLLYLLAVKITGKRGAGILSCLFFAFRSSRTLFSYLAELPKGTSIWKALADNASFISSTPNEDWGLWNLNVYCNQRHLAFGLSAVFLVLLLFLPNLYDMLEAVKNYNMELRENNKRRKVSSWSRLVGFIRLLILTRKGWELKDLRTAIAAGLLLGSLSFFHGAAVIGVLTILLIMAVISSRRLEYVIMALIAVTLSFLQTSFFIHGSAVSTQLLFGFIAENKTLFGVLSYLERLLGILPFVLVAALCLEKGATRYLILAFMAPLVFAFTVSLTVDVTVNHKYIMMSCILLGIFAASVVTMLLERRDMLSRIVGVGLIVLLTATGIYDFRTVLQKNTPESAIVLDLNHELTEWINNNSTSQDIFLTANYSINQVVLGGAMLYEGWPYYPWSAGYNTDYRTQQVKQMYEAATPERLKTLVEKNNIRFIIVDQDSRSSEDYALNETNISHTYQCVYSIGEGDFRTDIYDTSKPVW